MKFIVGDIYTVLEIIKQKYGVDMFMKIKFNKPDLRDMNRKFFMRLIENMLLIQNHEGEL